MGLTLGLLIGAIAFGLLLFWCCRRRRRRVFFDLLDSVSSPGEREIDMPPPAFEDIFEKSPNSSTLYENGVAVTTLNYEKYNNRKSALPPSEYGYGVGLSPLAEEQAHELSKVDTRRISTYKEVPPLRFSARSSRRMTRNSTMKKQTGQLTTETYQLNNLPERREAIIP